jgi:hypothetical protein
MSEEEYEVSATSPRRVSISISQKLNNEFKGHSSRVRMENQDSTMRLPVFHGTSRDYVENHRFTCEVIWYVKTIINETLKIA